METERVEVQNEGLGKGYFVFEYILMGVSVAELTRVLLSKLSVGRVRLSC